MTNAIIFAEMFFKDIFQYYKLLYTFGHFWPLVSTKIVFF